MDHKLIQVLLRSGNPQFAADEYEEQGEYFKAAWLREEGCSPPAVTALRGDGDGDSDGDGYGSGSGLLEQVDWE